MVQNYAANKEKSVNKRRYTANFSSITERMCKMCCISDKVYILIDKN